MIQNALSSIRRIVRGPEVTMIADAKDVSNECFQLIFHRLDKKSLLNCMLTCHRFNNLISQDSFWVEYARLLEVQETIPSLAWRRAATQKRFAKNEDGAIDVSGFNFNLKRMVLTGRGYSLIEPAHEFIPLFENAPNHIIQGTRRSDDFALRAPASGIQMEDVGHGCETHPDVSRCFTFSFSAGSIFIFIDLVASGIDPWVLDHVRPKIRITEKVNHRLDCAASLEVAAQLNYQETQWVQENGSRTSGAVDHPRYKSVHKAWEQWTEAKWEDVVIEFDNYPSGMRHLTVMHEGRDGQFWDGFYGPKVANIQIQVILPEDPILRPFEVDTERREEDDAPPQARRLPHERRIFGVPRALLHRVIPNE